MIKLYVDLYVENMIYMIYTVFISTLYNIISDIKKKIKFLIK